MHRLQPTSSLAVRLNELAIPGDIEGLGWTQDYDMQSMPLTPRPTQRRFTLLVVLCARDPARFVDRSARSTANATLLACFDGQDGTSNHHHLKSSCPCHFSLHLLAQYGRVWEKETDVTRVHPGHGYGFVATTSDISNAPHVWSVKLSAWSIFL